MPVDATANGTNGQIRTGSTSAEDLVNRAGTDQSNAQKKVPPPKPRGDGLDDLRAELHQRSGGTYSADQPARGETDTGELADPAPEPKPKPDDKKAQERGEKEDEEEEEEEEDEEEEEEEEGEGEDDDDHPDLQLVQLDEGTRLALLALLSQGDGSSNAAAADDAGGGEGTKGDKPASPSTDASLGDLPASKLTEELLAKHKAGKLDADDLIGPLIEEITALREHYARVFAAFKPVAEDWTKARKAHAARAQAELMKGVNAWFDWYGRKAKDPDRFGATDKLTPAQKKARQEAFKLARTLQDRMGHDRLPGAKALALAVAILPQPKQAGTGDAKDEPRRGRGTPAPRSATPGPKKVPQTREEAEAAVGEYLRRSLR